MIQANTPKHFLPTSEQLLAMIANAEAKFAGDREQCALRKEARAIERMEKAMIAEAKQRQYRVVLK